MKSDVIPIEIKGLVSSGQGWAVFVGNDEKVFVIQVDHGMGLTIKRFMHNVRNERPLTHDLINRIFAGFGITVEHVVITELKSSTYYARLVLKQSNELGTKVVSIDSRPSDCLALATAQKRPIYVTASLFAEVEDMSHILQQLLESGADTGIEPESE